MQENQMTIGSGAADMLGQGHALQQTQVGFHTAVYVQKERDIDKIEKSVRREAQFAGITGYYAWQVKNKKTGRKETVEGVSIGGEMIIAREWGNCVIQPTKFQETPDAFLLEFAFIDLEKGFTISRMFKQTKTKAPGNYGQERWDDTLLQIGQSKCIRNVGKAGTPAWLQDVFLKEAKRAVLQKIDKEGIKTSIDKVVAYLARHEITEDMIVETMGVKLNDMSAEDVAALRGMCQQIEDGAERAENLFKSDDIPVSDLNEQLKKQAADKKTGEIKTPAAEDPSEKKAEVKEEKIGKAELEQKKKDAKAAAKEQEKKLAAEKKAEEEKAAAAKKARADQKAKEKKELEAAAKAEEKKKAAAAKKAGPLKSGKLLAEFMKLDAVLACNRFLFNRKDEIEALPDEEKAEFFDKTEEHIKFVKEVARKEAQENSK